ncbi:MAG: hypothetical protein ACTSXY_09135 [Promethearchaeota archaeon]
MELDKKLQKFSDDNLYQPELKALVKVICLWHEMSIGENEIDYPFMNSLCRYNQYNCKNCIVYKMTGKTKCTEVGFGMWTEYIKSLPTSGNEINDDLFYSLQFEEITKIANKIKYKLLNVLIDHLFVEDEEKLLNELGKILNK